MIVAYALIVTFAFGMLVGSVATIVAYFRSSECCPMCSEPILKLVAESRKRAEDQSSTILKYPTD